ncbi:hypothetical protein PMAYCL1PPCAC_07357, partial [Pristionchus mayeri]
FSLHLPFSSPLSRWSLVSLNNPLSHSPFAHSSRFFLSLHSIHPMDSPRTPSEVEELNRILEVERQLVLRTQENYRMLKERSVQLNGENKELRKRVERLSRECDDLRGRRREEEEIEKKSREVIRQFDEDFHSREERLARQEVDTVAEIQRVFRKELTEREEELEKERRWREEAEEEGERMEEEMKRMREDERRRDKERREERSRLERQIENVLREQENPAASGREQIKHYESLLEHHRTLILELEDKVMKLTQESSSSENEYREEIREKEYRIREEREEKVKAEAVAARISTEYSQIKEKLARKEEKIESLERKINELIVAKSALEMEILDRERKELEEKDHQKVHFESRLASLEANFHRRNEEYNELSESLSELEDLRRSLALSEEKTKELEKEKEKRERKRREESEESRRGRVRMENEVERARVERDAAEKKCVELKKRLESDPETVEEVTRLKKKVREAEAELQGTREHYRDLLKRLKTSLRNLEIRHQRAQEKLTSHILI